MMKDAGYLIEGCFEALVVDMGVEIYKYQMYGRSEPKRGPWRALWSSIFTVIRSIHLISRRETSKGR